MFHLTHESRAHALAAALITVATAAGCLPAEAPPERTTRLGQTILDGEPASAAELFATVALVDPDGAAFCTGTLIAPRVVVSAAHCLYGDGGEELTIDDIDVVAGALVATDAGSDQLYRVASAVGHDGYDHEADPGELGRDDDIAVLTLETAVSGQLPAPIAPMSTFDDLVQPGDAIIITGYGARDPDAADESKVGVLYIAETPYEERSDHEYIAGATGEPDSCPGDSGGPGYAEVDGELVLIGAASRSAVASETACGEGGINTLVPAYASWIEANAEGLFEPGATDTGVTAAAGSGGGTTTDDGGCAIGAVGGHGPHRWLSLLLAAGLLALRRRPS